MSFRLHTVQTSSGGARSQTLCGLAAVVTAQEALGRLPSLQARLLLQLWHWWREC